MNKCIICDVQFSSKTTYQQFCSKRCGDLASHIQHQRTFGGLFNTPKGLRDQYANSFSGYNNGPITIIRGADYL